MKSILFASAALALAISAAPAAMAANAKTPYKNIDRSNDAGNNTGDTDIDKLNSAQLDQNYKGPYYPVQPGAAVPPPAAGSMPYSASDESPAPMKKPVARKRY